MADTKTVKGNITSAFGKSLKFFAKGNAKLREYLAANGGKIPYSSEVTLYADKADVETRRKNGWPSDSDIVDMLNAGMVAAERTKIIAEKQKEFGITKPELKNDKLAQFRNMRAIFVSTGMSLEAATTATEAALKFTEAEAEAADEAGEDESDE